MVERSLGDAAQMRMIVEQVVEATMIKLAPQQDERQPKKGWSDLASVAALILSMCSIVWTGGVIYGQQQEHSRRISALEAVDTSREPLFRDILVKLSRIEADIQSVKDARDEPR